MAEEESNDATAEADAEIEEEGQAAQVAHEAHHKPDRKGYWKIFVLLAALTAIEVGVGYLDKMIGKSILVTVLVCFAVAKAGIVAFFYMHLNHETKWMRWTVAIPLAFPALYAFILIAEGIYRAVWSIALGAGG
jgi:cytochrome c oxidase subunit IV